MLKRSFLIVGALCVVMMSSAQDDRKTERQRIQIGIKIGTNYSNVYDKQGEAFTTSPKYGFMAGGFLHIPVGKFLGIHPEFLYSQKGFHASGELRGDPYELSRTTGYIDIPLLVALKPVKYITLLAGPQYSYLVNQIDVFKQGTSTAINKEEFTNDNIRKNILGASLGVDINIAQFVFGARYAFDMLLNNGDGTTSAPRYKNVWLQASIGRKFF